jgi:hypothetical protein
VRKILCRAEKGKAVVSFEDYKHDNQVKDFYKLFKKASGYLALEYKESPEEIAVVSDNGADSISFGWNRADGCCVFAEIGDIDALVPIVYKMLCYRYTAFGRYEKIVRAALPEGASSELSLRGKKDEGKIDDDGDILADLEELVSLIPAGA